MKRLTVWSCDLGMSLNCPLVSINKHAAWLCRDSISAGPYFFAHFQQQRTKKEVYHAKQIQKFQSGEDSGRS